MYSDARLNIWIVLFSISYALLLAFICAVAGKKAGRVVSILLSIAGFLLYAANLVYEHIFSTILSITQIGMGPAAIKSFYRETLLGIKGSLIYLLVLLIPIAVLILFIAAGYPKKNEKQVKKLALLGASLILFAGTVFAVYMQPDANYGIKEIYFEDFVLILSEKDLGALTTTRLELKNILFGEGSASIKEESSLASTIETYYDPALYNVLDIDFEKLAKGASDSRHREIDRYFAAKTPTKKNEFTGKYKDYNVITILCESFSPYLIDKDRTPTLYKLSREGFSFTDYYSANDNNTSNSEYCFLTSLMPDETLFAPVGEGFERFREYNSCTASKNNYLPFTLGNEFKKRGIRTVFFHNYIASYYNRDLTHGNFGYELCTMKNGLSYSPNWPTSDLDLVNQAMKKLLEKNEKGEIEPFHAYFLSFSGHMAYNFETNQIAIANREEMEAMTEDMELSLETLAYMSCNLELEKALTKMLSELKRAGVLDKTLIVLAPDHYPYGLGIQKLSELAPKYLAVNKNLMELNKHKGCLLMWTPSMTEEDRVVVDQPVSELDILPTLLNLLGFEYDSRLLMGSDVFSDSKHIAIFDDRSFVTEDFYYVITTGEAVSRTKEPVDEEELAKYQNIVKNKFTISNKIMYSDYYRHVFENK